MTTSETLYRAEELFQERLKAKTNWGRNELIKEFQACIRQALGENLDAYEAKDANEGDIRPKGYGNIVLGNAQKHRTIRDSGIKPYTGPSTNEVKWETKDRQVDNHGLHEDDYPNQDDTWKNNSVNDDLPF